MCVAGVASPRPKPRFVVLWHFAAWSAGAEESCKKPPDCSQRNGNASQRSVKRTRDSKAVREAGQREQYSSAWPTSRALYEYMNVISVLQAAGWPRPVAFLRRWQLPNYWFRVEGARKANGRAVKQVRGAARGSSSSFLSPVSAQLFNRRRSACTTASSLHYALYSFVHSHSHFLPARVARSASCVRANGERKGESVACAERGTKNGLPGHVCGCNACSSC